MNDAATEQALVDRCRKLDVDAFGKLVDAYQGRVFGFVRRMVQKPEEAEDITQEVFIRAFQSFERFDGRSSVRTWLFRIAYNLCIDRSRKLGRTFDETSIIDSELGEEIEISDQRWQPDQLFLDTELMDLVESALATMSDKLKSVLLLHDKEDLQYEEIAKMLGVPVGTVKSRLFLARAHLQNAVSGYLKVDEAK